MGGSAQAEHNASALGGDGKHVVPELQALTLRELWSVSVSTSGAHVLRVELRQAGTRVERLAGGWRWTLSARKAALGLLERVS
jgi:hypothetical protein